MNVHPRGRQQASSGSTTSKGHPKNDTLSRSTEDTETEVQATGKEDTTDDTEGGSPAK